MTEHTHTQIKTSRSLFQIDGNISMGMCMALDTDNHQSYWRWPKIHLNLWSLWLPGVETIKSWNCEEGRHFNSPCGMLNNTDSNTEWREERAKQEIMVSSVQDSELNPDPALGSSSRAAEWTHAGGIEWEPLFLLSLSAFLSSSCPPSFSFCLSPSFIPFLISFLYLFASFFLVSLYSSGFIFFFFIYFLLLGG